MYLQGDAAIGRIGRTCRRSRRDGGGRGRPWLCDEGRWRSREYSHLHLLRRWQNTIAVNLSFRCCGCDVDGTAPKVLAEAGCEAELVPCM